MTETNSSYTGNVSALAFGGQGIIRQEGMVVFIPFTAVGDKISYQITERKKNFAVGQLEEILEPSVDRITPPCPYFGTCGGCQIQHLSYSAQLTYKRQAVEEALKRIGGFTDLVVPPVIEAKAQWAYRRQIHLSLKVQENHFVVGYIAVDNKSILAVDFCPIFTKETDPIISVARKIVSSLFPTSTEEGKLTLLKNEDNGYFLHFHFKKMPKNMKEALEYAKEHYPSLSGIVATSPKETLSFGPTETTIKINKLSFTFSPKVFIQNHPEQSLKIYQSISDYVRANKTRKVLDLYCGIGISSLLIASHGISVTGIEINKEAIRLATANAIQNNLNQVQFICGDVERVLSDALDKERPDLIIVNPPREGLSPKVAALLKNCLAKHIIYVSCQPATLARDLKLLAQGGYDLASIQPYDMFPQTFHVETIAILKAKSINPM